MTIRFLDLTRQHREIEAELHQALGRVFLSSEFILGNEVAAFEAEWAAYCSAEAAAGVACGTDALALALVASGAVRAGSLDEVITSPLTAGYTALAILNAGGVPVFADIDPRTYTLDPAAVASVITPRTRAIVPVHLYGQMCDMEKICSVAARHGLIVVEDAAHAHGARLDQLAPGSFGAAAAFSFYPTKNLGGCGDGGAVVSNDLALIDRVRTLRRGGHPAAMSEGVEGRNSRLDEIQAALLRVKLRCLDEWNERRRRLARIYDEALARVPQLQLPFVTSDQAHVRHLYVIQHPQRDRLCAHLNALGIETLVHYPVLLHQQRLFRRSEQPALPVAERVAPQLLSLPLYPQLKVDEAQSVAEAILNFN